jgi:streptogramin lyase
MSERLRAILAVVVGVLLASPVTAQTKIASALSGVVSSGAEGAMEGVLVSARKSDGTITVTVVSDQNGAYRFPVKKLSPGRYTLSIRAIGYELAGEQSADIAAGKSSVADLHLVKATDLAAQLTNTEWFMSIPGTDEQKKTLLECMSCHTLERIVRSHYDADAFVPLLTRMANYANNSTVLHPQKRVAERVPKPEVVRKAAEYLATINLSAAPVWPYALKTLPRPQGRATQAIVTEFAMPRETIAPHDVRRDTHGTVWFSEFGEPFLGALDPRSGKVAEYPIPVLKPGFPTGALDLEPDADGNFWLALMFQGGLAKFDVKARKFTTWPVQPALNNDATQESMVMPLRARVDGKVWTNLVDRQVILRLDLASGAFELIDPFKNAPNGRVHSPYGMTVDARNDLFFMDFGDENIVRMDAATGAATIYPTPTPQSRPRRGIMDAEGRIWFAEFAANRIGMFDTKEESFREWEAPTPWTAPYDAAIDKNGEVWSGGMSNDRVLRLDPVSGHAIEYLLPHPTNIRRILVDDSTNPVTFWAGNNHHAAIIKLEPTD